MTTRRKVLKGLAAGAMLSPVSALASNIFCRGLTPGACNADAFSALSAQGTGGAGAGGGGYTPGIALDGLSTAETPQFGSPMRGYGLSSFGGEFLYVDSAGQVRNDQGAVLAPDPDVDPAPSAFWSVQHPADSAQDGLIAFDTNERVWMSGVRGFYGTLPGYTDKDPLLAIAGTDIIAVFADMDGFITLSPSGVLRNAAGTAYDTGGAVTAAAKVYDSLKLAFIANSTAYAIDRPGASGINTTTAPQLADAKAVFASRKAVFAVSGPARALYGALAWGGDMAAGDENFHSQWTPSQRDNGAGGTVQMDDVAAVSSSGEHILILREDGSVWWSGSNDNAGTSGSPTELPDANAFVQVLPPGSASRIFADDFASLYEDAATGKLMAASIWHKYGRSSVSRGWAEIRPDIISLDTRGGRIIVRDSAGVHFTSASDGWTTLPA